VPRLSAAAVALGLALDQMATLTLLTVVTSGWFLLRHGSAMPEEASASLFLSSAGLAVAAACGAASSVFAGYAAGRFAARREVAHGTLVGVGDVVIGVIGVLLPGEPAPLWYLAIAFTAAIPAATLGGHLARLAREIPG
jgi:hypothetical protein